MPKSTPGPSWAIFIPGSSGDESSESSKGADEGVDDDGGKEIEPFKEGDGADNDDGEPLISASLDDEDGDPLQESEGAADGVLVPSKEVDGASAGGGALKEGEGEGDAAIDELLPLHLDLNRLRNPVFREGSGLLVLLKL